MSKKVELLGNVVSVARTAGKAEAKVVLSIPSNLAGEIPLGGVSVIITPAQSTMFDAGVKIRGGEKK